MGRDCGRLEFGHILLMSCHQRYQRLLPGSQTPECAGSWCSTISVVPEQPGGSQGTVWPSPVSGEAFAAHLLPWKPCRVSYSTNLSVFPWTPGLSGPGGRSVPVLWLDRGTAPALCPQLLAEAGRDLVASHGALPRAPGHGSAQNSWHETGWNCLQALGQMWGVPLHGVTARQPGEGQGQAGARVHGAHGR